MNQSVGLGVQHSNRWSLIAVQSISLRSIIDLTGNDESVAESVDLTKDPEVLIDLCSATLHSSSSYNSKLMPCNILQDSDNSVDSKLTFY